MNIKKIGATGIFVLCNSVLIGLQGMVHGITEIMKGNVPTAGMLLADIGAITLIQNYLYTGIAATISGAALLFWALFFLQDRLFPFVFFLLCAALFLSGGGVGFIAFFLFAFTASFQIKKPFGFVEKMLSGKAGDALSRIWPGLMILSFGCAIIGVLIWLFLIPPGIEYKVTATQYACWAFLAAGLVGFFPALFASHARDIKRMN